MKRLVQNKKALSMALAAALAIAPVNAFAASNDIRGHWAERTITQWQDKGLIGGYQDGTFKPDKPATRAEFARIMNQALGLNHKGNVSFSDVSGSDWFYNDVAIAMGEQYTAGYPDGTFKPNEIITRAQAAVFIAKALGASGGSLASFKDASSIPAWAQGAVGGIVEKGYMSGYPDGTFRPNAVLTRAEAVSTLNRIMGGSTVAEETKPVEKDVVIDQSGTKLKDQTIEGNLTISDKVGKGNVTLSNVEIKGNLIIQGGGENSVYLGNTTVAGKTVMDKKNVRLELTGKTKLPNVEIKEACNLTTSNFSGEVKRISITSSVSDKTTIGVAAEKLYVESKADIYITKDIDQVVVEKNAAGTKIEVGSNAKVSTLTADGKVALNGKGKVSTLEANVDGITYASDITITKTETAKGVDKPEKTNKNGTGGGSSSSDSSSSKKSVSAIAVTGTAVVGAKLTATTTPTAATGTYQWQRCDTEKGTYTNITGATASTYTIATGDEGKYLRVVFSASGSYKGTQTSTATAAIGTAVVPSVKVTALAFTDTDTDASQMGGTVTWTAPTNISNVTGYVVYASADGTTLGTKLGEVVVGTNQLVIPANTTYAAHIIVVAKNATGEAEAANYVSIAVTDVVATATPVISGTPKAGDTTITGTCVDGATVAVSINGGVAAAATVTETNWTITVPALVAGNTISVVATKAPHTASAAATATVASVVPGAAVTGFDGALQLGETTTAIAATTEAGAGTWTSSNTAVATVDGSTGAVTALTAGTTTIAYTVSASGNVNSKEITVYAAAAVANPTIGTVQVGEANVTPTGFTAAGAEETIAWTSSDVTKATVDVGTGVIAAVAAGDTTISYKVTETATGKIVAKGQLTITVQAAAAAATVSSAATTDATHIVLTMSSALTGAAGDAAAFTVAGAATSPTVTNVAVSGTTVTLTLSAAIANGETITLSYAKTGTNDLTNGTLGTLVANFTNQAVTNNVAAAAATVSSAATSDATHMVLTMSSALTGAAGDAAAFTVAGAATSPTVTSVAVSGTTVTLTLSAAIANGETITVSYAKTGTNDLTNGTLVANFTNQAVTNNV